MKLNQLKATAYRNPMAGRIIFESVRKKKALYSRMNQSPFEPMALLRRLRGHGLDPSLILDVGANRGEWTRNAASTFERASYRMIEPQLEMRPFLEQTRDSVDSAEFLMAGAGAVDGELELTIWEDLAGSSFMEHPGDSSLPKRVVPVVTLDSLVESCWMPIPDLVKMDVQGFELEVMKGASRIIGKTEIFILEAALMEFMEGRPLVDELISKMSDYGYLLYDIGGAANRPGDGVLSHLDLCFASSHGPLRRDCSWF